MIFVSDSSNVRFIIIIIIIVYGQPVNENNTDRNRFSFSLISQTTDIPELQTNNWTEIYLYVSAETSNFFRKNHVNLLVECLLIWLFASLRLQEQANKRHKYFSIYGVNFYAISNKLQMCLCLYVITKRRMHKSKPKLRIYLLSFDSTQTVSSMLNVLKCWIYEVKIRYTHYMR